MKGSLTSGCSDVLVTIASLSAVTADDSVYWDLVLVQEWAEWESMADVELPPELEFARIPAFHAFHEGSAFAGRQWVGVSTKLALTDDGGGVGLTTQGVIRTVTVSARQGKLKVSARVRVDVPIAKLAELVALFGGATRATSSPSQLKLPLPPEVGEDHADA